MQPDPRKMTQDDKKCTVWVRFGHVWVTPGYVWVQMGAFGSLPATLGLRSIPFVVHKITSKPLLRSKNEEIYCENYVFNTRLCIPTNTLDFLARIRWVSETPKNADFGVFHNIFPSTDVYPYRKGEKTWEF